MSLITQLNIETEGRAKGGVKSAQTANGAIMPPAGTDAGPLRFSTETFAERDRSSALREILGREVSRLEIEPLSDRPYAHLTGRCIGGIPLITIDHSLMQFSRTRTLLADGDDSLVLSITGGGCKGWQFGREIATSSGDAVLTSNGDAVTLACFGKASLIKLAPEELRPLVADFDAAVMRRVPADTPALWFLRSYIGLGDQSSTASAELRELLTSHVYDLAALALGATRDAAEIARTRGLRAARLQAARMFVLRNLNREGLSAATVAAHLGVTTRYIHMLFAGQGPSFAQFVLDARLALAHRMLQQARHAGKSISTIVFSLGFVDLSHFNRSFRRRYGCTPSEVRTAAAQGDNDRRIS